MRFLLLILFVSGFLFANSLRVSNFVDYIDIEVLKDFASKNGIEIIYDTHGYNEDIYNKLLNNSESYDVAFITSNYIEKLKKQNLITEIEKDKLSNYKNIDQKILE